MKPCTLMKMLLAVFLLCVLIIPPAVPESADPSAAPIRFSDGKAEVTVSDPGEQLIHVDYEGRDIFDLTIKSSNEKSILYNLDRDGIHIVPMTAGKTKLTIASRSGKKARLEITVTVDGQAVADLDDGPLTAYVMSDYSYVLPTGKPTLKYFICGGKKPYSQAMVLPLIETFSTSGMYQKIKDPKPYGKANLKFDTGSRSIQTSIQVVDADLNMVEVQGTSILVKHSLSVLPEYLLFRSPVNEPIEIPYTIMGGSGSYSVTEKIRLIKDYTTLYENTRKYTSTGTGVISYSPAAEGVFGCTLEIQDRKTKEIIYFDPFAVEITADEWARGVFDKTQISVDEPVTMTVSFSRAPESAPAFYAMGNMKYQGKISYIASDPFYGERDERNQSFTKEVEQIDDLTYKVTFIPHCEGSFYMFLMTDGFLQYYSWIRSFIQVLE